LKFSAVVRYVPHGDGPLAHWWRMSTMFAPVGSSVVAGDRVAPRDEHVDRVPRRHRESVIGRHRHRLEVDRPAPVTSLVVCGHR
jgi:hypothetical protein